MSRYVMDTDVLSLYQHGHVVVVQHVQRVAPADLALTIISVEEQLLGWQAALKHARQPDEIAKIYDRFTATLRFLSGQPILSFTEQAIRRYTGLVALKLNVGKMDLRIAAIALEHAAIVVTRNLRDFQRVPGLSVEDWTVP